MARRTARKLKPPLRNADFAGDGEPYTEVIVTVSIRILGSGITRSRLAVNVYPDPALEELARGSLRALKKENYGYNEEGVFGACLSDNFNAWEDMDKAYPKISEDYEQPYHREDARKMNEYIADSVEWALSLHKKGMEEARRNEGHGISQQPPHRMM